MPLLARDSCGRADGQPHTAGPQEGSRGAGILAQVEVDLRAVLVAVVRRLHGAECVRVGGAEVVHLGRSKSANVANGRTDGWRGAEFSWMEGGR